MALPKACYTLLTRLGLPSSLKKDQEIERAIEREGEKEKDKERKRGSETEKKSRE